MIKPLSNTHRANRSLPAIIAVGSSLIALPASALELGELTVQSRLGQPLRASIAYALAPNEQLSDYCVTMRPGASVSGLPGFGTATVSVANGVIMLTGKTPVREPMVSAHVIVNCPYSANLSREYLLFIDPLTSAYDQPVVRQQANSDVAPVTVAAAAAERPVVAAQKPAVNKDIATSTRYRVQRGDSLSTIAARIQNRSVGLWPAVNAIFAANPDAFLNNDPNQLKSGSSLLIPDFGGNAAVVSPAEPAASASLTQTYVSATPNIVENLPTAEASTESVPSAEATDIAVATPELTQEPVFLDELDSNAIESRADVTTASLQPGDIIFDAQLEGPKTASQSPNVPTAIITTKGSGTDGSASSSWLVWLAGSGIALILGLLMFGRRLRGQAPAAPSAPQAAEELRRRYSDTETTDTENVEALVVDFDLSDDSPTEENLILDADLIIGTGLEAASSSNLSQDFGFAATTELDLELPFEPIAKADDKTDILPPLRTDEHSILDSEVLPGEDDYDMSVIIDATKMPQPEDVTERDLKAVEVATDDESMIVEHYTINKQADFHVLEQDYEDELTATQALNEEIARAAAELVAGMDTNDSDEDITAEMPLATVTELDITAQMPAQNDPISDPDATGVNEEITISTAADDETVEMSVKSEKAG